MRVLWCGSPESLRALRNLRPSRTPTSSFEGAAVENAVQPWSCVGEVAGAGVEQLELLGDHPRRGELLGRVADGQGQLEPGPLGCASREPGSTDRSRSVTNKVTESDEPNVMTWTALAIADDTSGLAH